MFNLTNGRVHGNGFIQFDLAPGIRLHIFPPANKPIIAQKVNTPIHDHVFDFNSYILCGELTNIHYEINHCFLNDPRSYQMYVAEKTANENTILVPIAGMGKCNPLIKEIRVFEKDECYNFPAFEFHESQNNSNDITATLMIKTRVYNDSVPRILCPANYKPDNDFDRYSINQEIIQEYVDLLEEKLKNKNIPGDYWRI